MVRHGVDHSGLRGSFMARKMSEIGGLVPTNGAVHAIAASQPYTATVLLKGTADLLFHRWNCEAVEEKANAAKGSKAKKSDDVESYVYRDDSGFICLPGEYVRQAVIHAAKFRQDPRSPRKSAMDLFKAGVVSLTMLAQVKACNGMDRSGKAGCGTAGLGPVKAWDYEHKCRVCIQRSGVTRTRPAIKAGWQAEFQLGVLLPEYIRPHDLQDVLTNAGKLIGLADFRPTYGRFQVAMFDIGLG